MKTYVGKWMVKIICLLLVLCGLQVFSEKNIANAYTTHTVDEAIAWAASKVGQSLEGDNYYGPNNSCAYQCVDFIICYYKYLGVTPSTGNGCDYATNALPVGWTRVKGGRPQKGDILVYSANASNKAGHVAIYESDRSTYHQNFNNCRKVTHETYQYNKISNEYWGYIRPDWTTAHNPFGFVDSCESKTSGKLYVAGWAIDEDNYGAQLDIHVYVGPEDNAIRYNIGAANTERPDVDDAHHCGKYHGFNKVIDVDRTGWQRVRIFAINVGGGNNRLLYDNTVYIKSDSEKPELHSYDVSDLGEHGYSVSVIGYDNVGITNVKFAVKLENSTSDFVWYDGELDRSYNWVSESRWIFTLSNGICGEKYTTNVYMYDAAGNCTNFSIPPIKLGLDTEKPIVKSSSVYQEVPGIVIVKLDLFDNYGLGQILADQRYKFSRDENSGVVIGYTSIVKAEDDCWWGSSWPLKSIVASQKTTELQETISCDGIIGYTIAISDLTREGSKFENMCYADIPLNGVELKGLEGRSNDITIKTGEKIKIGDITKWNDEWGSYQVYFDGTNQRILKKVNTDAESKNDVELIGNEEGVEYVYFVGYATGVMCSCRIVVKSDENVEDGLITIDDGVTPTPTKIPDESNVTPSPTGTPDETNVTPNLTGTPDETNVTPSPTKTLDRRSSSVSVKKPGKVKNIRVKNKKKKKMVISWNWKLSVSGFQIQYAQNKKFTKKKKGKMVGKWTSQKTITKLEKGKTYYVRVRAYKKSAGRNIYGNWSKIKKIKIRK